MVATLLDGWGGVGYWSWGRGGHGGAEQGGKGEESDCEALEGHHHEERLEALTLHFD